MNIFPKPTMLMILDGFGISKKTHGNAIYKASTPNLDRIFSSYPYTELGASGLDVGLPDGQMGNSEVGHLNIGAGRIVYQELTRITKSIADDTFFENAEFIKAMKNAEENGRSLHIMGLLSDGGVHSHIDHLKALIDMASKYSIRNVFIHAFLDGRDVPPRCACEYIRSLEDHIRNTGSNAKIATISGRYYAMDRDKRWERIKLAYDAIMSGSGKHAENAEEAVMLAYERKENDEFVLPTVIDSGFSPVETGDSVILFNFRPDRAREITRAIVSDDFDFFKRDKKADDLVYVCMTQYDAEMPNVTVAFPPEKLKDTLGEYLSSLGLRQLRIAETEKYAHVTFFFNGGVEEPNKNEERILIPSPKVATYDLKPDMSANEVTDAVLSEIEKDRFDVIILNFANADMVGHTGIMDAAIAAVETLDKCVKKISDRILEKGGQILLTADHGNADLMLDDDDNVVTAHSTNPVPLVHISAEPKKLSDGGKLADIAPTLLTLMGLPVPELMTGRSLVEE